MNLPEGRSSWAAGNPLPPPVSNLPAGQEGNQADDHTETADSLDEINGGIVDETWDLRGGEEHKQASAAAAFAGRRIAVDGDRELWPRPNVSPARV